MMNIHEAFKEIAKDRVSFFWQYTYNRPLVMSVETFERTKQLGKILNKAICYFAGHYRDFPEVFLPDSRDLEVLDIANRYPFKVGTFRTDFILTPQKEMKIIEMTTRYPLNVYFSNGYVDNIAKRQAAELQLCGVKDLHPQFLNYFQKRLMSKARVTVIKGKEKMVDFKDYSKIIPLTDIEFNVIELENLSEKLSLLENANVIGEWSIEEIKSLPDPVLDKLCAAGIFNDFRNILLVHDKRFFALLSHLPFLVKALTKEEQALLAEFTFPTYVYQSHEEQFETARFSREEWILKPYRAGKSEGVVAGCLTSADEWEQLFKSGIAQRGILQPMQQQWKFSGAVGDEIRIDNSLTGTLLYFDNEYFGPAMYRASSAVVCFQGDDRRVPSVVANRENRFADITI